MNPEHWIETVILTLGFLGAVAVWAFNVESRLRVLERVFADHVRDKAEALAELKHDLHGIKQTLEQLTRRCIAFRHYEHAARATLAGVAPEPDEEEIAS